VNKNKQKLLQLLMVSFLPQVVA